ncbi:hypothetical protein [Streptomyces sp. NRRL S-241]|uniref:hypothetical protein n=1 Tax=Streptomyces sp. NRRL S-241 TaxID=1463896 RepID=UPI0004C0F686|nr:hypothetical protein [Streptomyces sp. NRRL S-241]
MKNRIMLINFIVALTAAVAVGATLPADVPTTFPASQVLADDAGWQSPAPLAPAAVAFDAGWQ